MSEKKTKELRRLQRENVRLRALTVGAIHGDKSARVEREACAITIEGLVATIDAEPPGKPHENEARRIGREALGMATAAIRLREELVNA